MEPGCQSHHLTPWEPGTGFEDLQFHHYERRERVRGGGVGRVVINRSDRMNAINDRGFYELGITLNHAIHDNSVGVVVLTRNGPHFGVRGDVEWEAAGGLENIFTTGGIGGMKRAYHDSKKPIICAVRGYLIGASHHMAYSCDFPIAGERAIFGQNGPRIGSPIAGHLVASTAHIVGQKRGREIWMRCRQYTAQETLQMGLCNVVVHDRLWTPKSNAGAMNCSISSLLLDGHPAEF